MKLQKNQSILFLGSTIFLTVILFTQINENNTNSFFLNSEPLRIVGENYRGSTSSSNNGNDSIPFGPVFIPEDSDDTQCYTKHVTTLLDQRNKELFHVESGTVKRDFKSLSLTTGDKKIVDSLKVEILAYCDTDKELPFWENLSIMDSSKLKVSIFSTDSSGDYINTNIKNVDIKTTNLVSSFGDKWNTVGTVIVDMNEINDKLEKSSEYISTQRIEVSGMMKIDHKDDNSYSWSFYLDPLSRTNGIFHQISYVVLNVVPTGEKSPDCSGRDCRTNSFTSVNTYTPTQKQSCDKLGGKVNSDDMCVITKELPKDNPKSATQICSALDGKYDVSKEICVITKELPKQQTTQNVDDDLPLVMGESFLNYEEFLNCKSTDCFNDQKFIPIYAILGAIMLLAVFQTKRQSRVVMME